MRPNQATLSPHYRPDIDGLRAVAVLFVVGYHAFPMAVRGGFIGVDVFFVISGYLITSILLKESGGGLAGLWHFYDRRIRRIFPALLLVLAASLAAGWLLLLPGEYAVLGKHAAAGAGFASNFVLWGESGYFDAVSESKLLLHLWSLAIEEQFYLVWPLALIAVRSPRARLAMLVLLGLASLGLNITQVRGDRMMVFYSPLSRAWELLVGAGLAYHAWRAASPDRPRAAWRAAALSWMGTLLLAIGLIAIRPHHPYPGTRALLPVLGAALLIAAGPAAWVNRHLLGLPFMAAIGRISYPLYLWHWPLLGFAFVLAGETPSAAIRAVLIAIAAALAWASERWLERRARGSGSSLWPVVLIVLMALVGSGGWSIHRSGGWPARPLAQTPAAYPGDVGHERFHAWRSTLANACQTYGAQPYACFQSPQGRIKPTIAVFGDSHAEHLGPGLAERLPDFNVTVFSALGLPTSDTADNHRLVERLVADSRIGSTLIVAFWDRRRAEQPDDERWRAELVALARRLAAGGRRPVFVEDVPVFGFSPQRCQYDALPLRPTGCEQARELLERQRARYLLVLARAAREAGVPLLEVADLFCDAVVCRMQAQGRLLYRDPDHLGIEGTRRLADGLLRRYPQILAREQP